LETIAHYRITSKLGEGGMGAVYRATDTKLGRDVAIKVISASFAEDPERLARFTREAQVLASLNHPNIAAIHGVEERALVMELVEGEDLHGPLPLETALDYAGQIAEALEYAHEKGIIHRDLKPANIKVTGPASGYPGKVKVLDFGLAKALAAEGTTGDPTSSPTLTMGATVAGVIMGTPGYMSPEQAKGKPVDRGADIWAFGVVLWEMLTGRALFAGETVTDTLAQVLTKEPDWSQAPAQVRRLLRSCLQKEPKQRLKAIGDWQFLLEEPAAAPVAPARPTRLPWAIAGLLAVALGIAAWGWLHRTPQTASGPYSLYMVPPEGASFHLDTASLMQAISPDGRTLAFIADSEGARHIWVRPLDSSTARPLAGTELADGLFWSPDARFLGFMAGNGIKIVEVATGAVKDLCDGGSSVRGATWNGSGTIVFGTTGSPLMRVSADGGTPVPVTVFDPQRENNHLWPQFLPNGKHFLYWIRGVKPETSGIYAGSLEVAPEQQIHQQILATPSNALYADRHLLFLRGKTLFAQRFDPDRLTLEGSPSPIADNVASRSGLGQFSVSQNGILTTSAAASLSKSVTVVSRDGAAIESVGKPDAYNSLRLSPDGHSVALLRTDESSLLDIWLMDLARGAPVRLTDGPINLHQIWSPDGKEIVFASNRGAGGYRMYRKPIAGNGAEESLLPGDHPQYPSDWSRDGKTIAYWENVSTGRTQILLLPLAPGSKPIALTPSNANRFSPRLSPSGRWVAFTSNETGTFEIYVQALPGEPADSIPKVRISNAGGLNPAWNADGSELYFNSLDDRLMAVAVKSSGGRFEAGDPKLLFPLGGTTLFNGGTYWEPIGNGQRFVVLRPVPVTGRDNRIGVIVNWQAALKE